MPPRPSWVGADEPAEGVNDALREEYAARGGVVDTLRLSSVAAASVDAYVEYRRIVGDADGGMLLSGASGSVAARPSQTR